MSEQRHIRTNHSTTNSGNARKINRSNTHTAPQQPVHHNSNGDAGARKHKKKKKKKMRWWVPLLVVVCILGVCIGGILGYVNHILNSIAPPEDAQSLEQQIQTAPEYKGDVVNILVCGIDYEEGRTYGDKQSNDGMTDMIMYVNYDLKNGKMNMLQIPRNTLVGFKVTCDDTTGKTYKASNGQINSIALSNEEGIAALADVIANNYKLPVDYYATIDMEALVEMVDHFGGLDVYVPQDIKDGKGSTLEKGYRRLDGATVEYLVRQRHAYANGDLGRLNTQRYFYAALFNRVRTASLGDIIKLMPVVQNYVTTNIPAKDLVSLAYSFLSIDSADIMVAQTPVCSGALFAPKPEKNFKGHSVLVPARQEIADLLNQYYRTYTGEVSADQLKFMDSHPHNDTPTPANVQFMGQLDSQANEAGAGQ